VTPFLRFGAIVVLSLLASGCVYINGERVGHDDWRDEQHDNRELISQLDIGTARAVVLERLGTPADSEAFMHDGEEVTVLFYRTQHRRSDGETTRDETTPLLFKNGLLVAWGQAPYDDMRP
jgi:outer membrane protein assembly factor BamE (lipoprotein component of BamABCDE complex)